ncbi:MAG: hypothetical protein R3262_11245 [Xanthomarina gelatinilytica]|nr:hypothetical protein [Xanthomarina gelatinilytica]
MNFIEWFEMFIEEKNLENVVYMTKFELDEEDMGIDVIQIDTEMIIETIKKTSQEQQEKIQEILIKLDFMNGDIHHFFNHLANGLLD